MRQYILYWLCQRYCHNVQSNKIVSTKELGDIFPWFHREAILSVKMYKFSWQNSTQNALRSSWSWHAFYVGSLVLQKSNIYILLVHPSFSFFRCYTFMGGKGCIFVKLPWIDNGRNAMRWHGGRVARAGWRNAVTARLVCRVYSGVFLFLCSLDANPMGVNGGVGVQAQSMLSDSLMHSTMNSQK